MPDFPQLLPADEFDRQLAAEVHPADWKNPTPSGRYNLVVIGAGTAGLVTAAGAAGLGARVALIERSLMGGDCLNVGCVPSKGVISAARAAAAVRDAGRFGVQVPSGTQVDFAAAMRRMRMLRARISPLDSAKRFRDLGVDVYFGDAPFVSSDTVDVDGAKLKFRRAVIATGARASAPSIPGLDSVSYLTNETLFTLTELPRRFGIIGAGPIGCEMAQAFARLGSDVYLVESGSGILPREDRDAAAIVQASLVRDGVHLRSGGRIVQIRPEQGSPTDATPVVLPNSTLDESARRMSGGHSGNSGVCLSVEHNGQRDDLLVDRLLVSVGRTPNIEGLNLDAAGVAWHPRGVTVNDRMQTTNPNVYAAGDVCSPYQFTHSADFMARIVIQNALFHGRRKSSSLVIPWCTYTSPEIAHVGMYEHQAREQNIAIDTYIQHLQHVDRAVLDGEDEGFVKVHVKRGTDKIVGATVVAAHAGDMISELTLAMTHGLGLSKIGSTIHPYPTQADAIRRLGDQYSRTRLTPFVKWLFQKWLTWTR